MTLRFLFPLAALALVFMLPNISTTSADQTIQSEIGRIAETGAPMESSHDAAATGRGPGWTQMWEVNRECIVEILGYMPESLSDLPAQEREKVLQACAKLVDGVPELGGDGSLVSVSLDAGQDSVAGAGQEPSLLRELEALDLYWGDKIDQSEQEWNRQIDVLNQEYYRQDQYWTREMDRKRQEFTSELQLIDGKIASLKEEWAAEAQEIQWKIDNADIRRVANLQRWLSTGRREFAAQRDELELWRQGLERDMNLQLGHLEISQAEELDSIALQQERLNQDKSNESTRLEQEWASEQVRLRHEFDAKVDFQTQQRQEEPTNYFGQETPPASSPDSSKFNYLAGDSPDPVDADIQTQRGFFINRQGSSLNTDTYRLQDPSVLAMIGILATLATAVLTLVRGR
ncbi:MAG: hypothetical protein IIB31_05810 [Chloroflexi bacterium]|nr:hypothetical protein [Chloroflexota bacterium]